MSTVAVREQQLLIGGEWTDAENGATFEKANPYTGETVTKAAAATAADANRAVGAAAAAFPEWSALPPAERRRLLIAAADLLDERAEQIAATTVEQCGATFGCGMFNCGLAAGMLREAAAQAYLPGGDLIPSDVPGLTAMGVRQPVGVVVGIAPWNAPVILATRAVATPLAYGNTVVLKASEQTPLTQAAIVQVLHDAGVPAGAVNLISNAPEDGPSVVEALIAHRAVTRVNFTGSSRVGRIIGELGGRHLTRVVLELGGKAPFLVLPDADLEEAAAAASFGSFMNQGEICMSTERVIVDRTVADELASRLAERASKLVVGPPSDPASQIGPLVHGTARDHVVALIEDARAN